jgi:DnaK suppressor protein
MNKQEKTIIYDLAVQKRWLIRELEQLKALENFEKEQDKTGSSRERTEIADAATEYERHLALGIQKKSNLDLIERALYKIDEGSYGICDDCSKVIDPARIEILPYANLCIDCCRNSNTPEKRNKKLTACFYFSNNYKNTLMGEY